MQFLKFLVLISLVITVVTSTYYTLDYFKNESNKKWWMNIVFMVQPPFWAGVTIYFLTVRMGELEDVITLLLWMLVALLLSGLYIMGVFWRRRTNLAKK